MPLRRPLSSAVFAKFAKCNKEPEEMQQSEVSSKSTLFPFAHAAACLFLDGVFQKHPSQKIFRTYSLTLSRITLATHPLSLFFSLPFHLSLSSSLFFSLLHFLFFSPFPTCLRQLQHSHRRAQHAQLRHVFWRPGYCVAVADFEKIFSVLSFQFRIPAAEAEN